jgi:hypothetical protein
MPARGVESNRRPCLLPWANLGEESLESLQFIDRFDTTQSCKGRIPYPTP